ncbi:MAG TPA: tRNA preQ1(34) S-adenosylmethionine ribosyltransferase-isomerase QueA [Syntrophomonadaceae bacterium]|nr:tRNA preQ1(34) S-adenosylmethionine ribosyltransferase-isomerase QueA [Syntrophomonadaceae bacterium]
MSEKQNPFALEDYIFPLPPQLIAQHPAHPRDHSRLLVVHRDREEFEDRQFHHLIDYLQSGDTLVINETRVIHARLLGYKDTGAQVEVLLLKKKGDSWEALVKPARRLKPGSQVYFSPERPEFLKIIADLESDGGRLVSFHNCSSEESFIEELGHVPLPPYINRPDQNADQGDYQTIYARESGSAAAPTAGLHFTEQLLSDIQDAGVDVVKIILHVGLGTFRPVNSADIRQHRMHSETYQVSEEAARQLNAARSRGGRIVAIGTTVVRTLETVYDDSRGFQPGSGETSLFIYPGYKFRAIDMLVSNFHLPGSSLLMLVSAFAGWEKTMAAYRHAVAQGYRFFSYGDATLFI